MKRNIILFYLALLPMFILSCANDDSTVTPTANTAGVFVLYEGLFPNSGDYAFISDSSDQVTNDLYSNSNSGAQLGLVPDGMYLRNNLELYITIQGNFGSTGRMYKINSRTNKLIDTTASFGTNPYSIAKDDFDRFFVTNIASDKVTLIDISTLQITNTYTVGQNPSEIVAFLNSVYVCKASYTTQNTLAIINISNNNVTFKPFPSTPVSACISNNRVYVSTYTNKVIYKMDSAITYQTADSIILNTLGGFTDEAVTDLVQGNNNFIYAVGSDTSAFGSTGFSVYKVDVINKTYTKIIGGSGFSNIYGIGFDRQKNLLWISDAPFSGTNRVFKYDADGNQIKVYDITGKFPRRFAFAY